MKTTTSQGRRLRPLLEQQRSAWRILALFSDTPKNARSFWWKYCALDPEDRVFLSAFYSLPSPRDVFRRICVFWNVPDEDEATRN